MRNNKYKILVLSDLKDSKATILKSTISLAKMIDADIQLFYVKKPTDIIEKDNQLSAIRTINDEYTTTNKKLENVVTSFSKDYGIDIHYKFEIGNVKNEIDTYIKEFQPDIIVLGKRKSKPLNFIGENIIGFVLKMFDGVIMIAGNENPLEPNGKLSLGLLNDIEHPFNIEFVENLMAHTQKPLKSFKIVKTQKEANETHVPSNKKIVEYVFEQGDNSIKNLSNYISKNDINLLCINREKKSNYQKSKPIKSNINDLINTLDVSLLLTGNHDYHLHR